MYTDSRLNLGDTSIPTLLGTYSHNILTYGLLSLQVHISGYSITALIKELIT